MTRKITSTVAAIARGEADELVLGNLDARRDWGWAPDYVDAMVRAARADEPDDYVVATGRAHSVRDFVAAAFAARRHRRLGAAGAPATRAFFRPADPTELVGDATKAPRRARLGAHGRLRGDRGADGGRRPRLTQPCWSRRPEQVLAVAALASGSARSTQLVVGSGSPSARRPPRARRP